jgi:hypothetical protein
MTALPVAHGLPMAVHPFPFLLPDRRVPFAQNFCISFFFFFFFFLYFGLSAVPPLK